MEWLAFWLAPAAATLQVGVGYALVKPACAVGGTTVLTALSVITFAMTVAGIWLSWRRRPSFVASVALGLNLLVAVLVIAATIPHFLLSPCE